jgi:DNA-binding NarL/FixJ family response regulator
MIGYRVLVVENDPFTLATMVNALEYQRLQVVGKAASAREALAIQDSADADVALLDLDLGVGPNGIDLAHALRVRQPGLGIVMLSTYRDPRLLAPGMPTAPRGTAYLSKGDITDFSQVVTQVVRTSRAPNQHRSTPTTELPQLTENQVDILRMVAAGMSTQAIAQERGVGLKAVEQTISRLCQLLDLPRDSQRNQRVRLARAYLELTGKVSETGQE